MVTATLITAAELERMPDGERFELVNGVLRQVSPPGVPHGYLQLEIGGEMRAFVRDHELGRVYGEIGILIAENPDTVLAPDVTFIRDAHLKPVVKRGAYLRQIPELVVEIVSPGDRIGEILAKAGMYLNAGIAVVWTVDPQKRRVMVWSDIQPVQVLGPDDTLDGGELLPGFTLQLGELFDDVDPAEEAAW